MTPATASGTRNRGAPSRPRYQAQTNSATNIRVPRMYSLRDDVSFTALPCGDGAVLPPLPTPPTMPPFVVPSPE